jgi:hypothetical protein
MAAKERYHRNLTCASLQYSAERIRYIPFIFTLSWLKAHGHRLQSIPPLFTCPNPYDLAYILSKVGTTIINCSKHIRYQPTRQRCPSDPKNPKCPKRMNTPEIESLKKSSQRKFKRIRVLTFGGLCAFHSYIIKFCKLNEEDTILAGSTKVVPR